MEIKPQNAQANTDAFWEDLRFLIIEYFLWEAVNKTEHFNL